MTILLWITGILTALYVAMRVISKLNPKQDGSDWILEAMQGGVGFLAIMVGVITLIVWL